jgi:predicted transcriptional regulator
MEPLCRELPDLVQIMIHRWVYKRIAALLAAANAGEYVDDERVEGYVVAVLEGHMRRLNHE